MSPHVSVRVRALLSALLIPVLLTTGISLAQDSSDTGIPPEVADHANEWPLANGDYANSRNAVSTIDTSNVADLGMAWSVDIPSASYFGALATNPLIIDGIVYIEDLTSHVRAFNLDDGSLIWEHDYAAENLGPNGVAVGWGKVFATVGATGVAALDINSGDELWNIDLPLGPTEGIDIQPSVYDGLVYVSSVPGVGIGNFYEGGGIGELFALDQSTGEIVWQFATVDSEDIWGNPDVNSGGGAWYPPAVDVDSGVTYWSAANPAPWPGTDEFPSGTSRPGPNLYTNSLLALQHDTGEMNWYTQVKPHDLFDLDLQLSPILGTANVMGTQHDAVFVSGKLGTVYAMDRQTGEILWSTDVGEHQNDHLDAVPEGATIKVLPGSLGGVETPMALADDNMLYVPLLNQASYYTSTGSADVSEDIPSTGQLLALDTNTGAILWNQHYDSPVYGAATVVNDLVFTATYDGTIHAHDRHTGDEVWQWTAPTGINGSPAVVGDTVVWPAGSGAAPQLIALRLGAEALNATDPSADMGSTSPDPEQTAIPEASDSENTSAPVASSDAEATPQADMGDMNMEATAEATADSAASGDLSQYISYDEASNTVDLTILANQGNVNGGLNFNGRYLGGATITVPEGATVNVTFTNVGDMPHSAMVVMRDDLQQAILDTPVFDGAATPNPQNGTAGGETVSFTFVANAQGDYVMACGVPGHGLAGQWVHFIVGASDVTPSFVESEMQSGGNAGTGV